ncbi:MAG: GNAT family N-acetyltransferase [Halobacteriovoraceae bacterium]|jgi:[ribosomal protein S5]-alanine N-acetyltransferase|nr:GNAT family N-acetyltransferase [Halobacteriovoraceae bacterium]MBT5092911.1 GNAT family N-acetyltransferase [Halobacteriovoraceae bacterium]
MSTGEQATSLRLEGERVYLRLATNSDAENFLKFYRDNESHLAPWDPIKPENFFTIEFWQAYAERLQLEYQNQSSLRLSLFYKENNLMIGGVNFTGFERGPFQNCRLGYKIHHTYEGQGLMFEGLKLALKHLFDEYNFHRCEANYITDNARSGKLLERLGFEKIGVSKNYLHIAGKWQDHMTTACINPSFTDF